jgi:hypothetical protein
MERVVAMRTTETDRSKLVIPPGFCWTMGKMGCFFVVTSDSRACYKASDQSMTFLRIAF